MRIFLTLIGIFLYTHFAVAQTLLDYSLDHDQMPSWEYYKHRYDSYKNDSYYPNFWRRNADSLLYHKLASHVDTLSSLKSRPGIPADTLNGYRVLFVRSQFDDLRIRMFYHSFDFIYKDSNRVVSIPEIRDTLLKEVHPFFIEVTCYGERFWVFRARNSSIGNTYSTTRVITYYLEKIDSIPDNYAGELRPVMPDTFSTSKMPEKSINISDYAGIRDTTIVQFSGYKKTTTYIRRGKVRKITELNCNSGCMLTIVYRGEKGRVKNWKCKRIWARNTPFTPIRRW